MMQMAPGDKRGDVGRRRFLHYPLRGYDKFGVKVRNTANWFEDNKHLEPWWGWHWRRWIRLDREGRLREDYGSQFVSPAQAEELVRAGICSVDDTVAGWMKQQKPHAPQQRLRPQRKASNFAAQSRPRFPEQTARR
jgi:hypothetical protein